MWTLSSIGLVKSVPFAMERQAATILGKTKASAVPSLEAEGNEVSIIVPTLNEESTIGDLLKYLDTLDPKPSRIIVVDGGSTDKTVRIAGSLGAMVLKGNVRGRASQMNYGASFAKSDYLCFLHADTLPPQDMVRIVQRVLSKPKVVVGGLRLSMEENGQPFILANINSLLKTWYIPLIWRPLSFPRGLRCIFGDQIIFCRKSDFDYVGGYRKNYPIMEDLGLCIDMHMRAMHRNGNKGRGRIEVVMGSVAKTSARRVSKWGNLRALYVYIVIGMHWHMGASPQKVQQLYDDLYTDSYR